MEYTEDQRCGLVEFDEFQRFAEKHLAGPEREELLTYLALMPEAGAIIPGTGGVRKLRWAAKGKGKSGGVRVIYYFYDLEMPLLLLTGFAKNEMKDIGPVARNLYKRAIPALVKHYIVISCKHYTQ